MATVALQVICHDEGSSVPPEVRKLYRTLGEDAGEVREKGMEHRTPWTRPSTIRWLG